VPSLLNQTDIPRDIYIITSPETRFLPYFILGGTIVAITTYIASRGSGTPAAFINTLPSITATTFPLIYVEGGSDPVRGYTQSILIFTPPWKFYMVTVFLEEKRFKVFKSIALEFIIYLIASYFVRPL
jgi:hypothetical protein